MCYRNRMKAFYAALVITLILSAPLQARSLGMITNGEGEVKTEESINRYYISCVSNIDNAAILIAPDTKQPLIIPNGSLGNLTFKKGTDFQVANTVEVNSKQFLAGKLIQYAAGGHVYSIEKPNSSPEDENRDMLYVLPKEWDCSLYKGDNEVDCSCCAMTSYLLKKNKEYEHQCKTVTK